MADLVRYEVKDGVAVVTIDNPPVNALAPAVWTEIDDAVKRGVADPAADAIVLIGAGTTFIAGADIKAFDLLKTPADSLARSDGTHALPRLVPGPRWCCPGEAPQRSARRRPAPRGRAR